MHGTGAGAIGRACREQTGAAVSAADDVVTGDAPRCVEYVDAPVEAAMHLYIGRTVYKHLGGRQACKVALYVELRHHPLDQLVHLGLVGVHRAGGIRAK